jgi:hypothetical protein
MLDTNIAGLPGSVVQYYSDDTTPSETQCTGDAFQYGASGATLNVSIPNTDPSLGATAYLTAVRRMTMLEPGATIGTAARIGAQTATPLGITVTPFVP